MKKWLLCTAATSLLFLGTSASAKQDSGGYIIGQSLPSSPTVISGIVLVNKQHPLPKNYTPGENKQARSAFTRWQRAAKKAGYSMTAFSTYRSFTYQQTLYNRYVAQDGKKAADRYSARPGYSEHQTGLAFDIGNPTQTKHYASQSFGTTATGKWAAKTAHRYGFIMRYPKGKTHITGYMYEPWHFRYVGKSRATKIYNKQLTLEQYLNVD
jgi:zinc D-Ala-D-Ala carboxypeptidase